MEFTPKEICEQLDKRIIGQKEAKKAVAIALRNRYRRRELKKELRDEITPKNIIMKGPTGVGKTEIARRLANLVKAPFVKVEATKFTEVGYVGRDVESMIRDLVESSVRLVKEEKFEEVREKAEDIVREKIVNAIAVSRKKADINKDVDESFIRGKLREEYEAGKLENEIVEIDIAEAPKQMNMMPGMGMEINIGEMLGGIIPQRRKRKKLTVRDAKSILISEECEKLVDLDSVNAEAIRRAEQDGIIFIDEIDKITGKGGGNGPDVSREGVQRDILPIVEGCSVNTKYGTIKTDYILFISAGAFSNSNVSDLIPELQGRFPVVVELDSLDKQDFIDILTKTEHSLITQYTEMLKVDNINLIFKSDAIEEIAEITAKENVTIENIGARRLHTVLEAVLEEISFNATGKYPMTDVIIDREFVKANCDENKKRKKSKPRFGFVYDDEE